MRPQKEGEPQTAETQKESLTINQVLDSVYDELVSEIDPRKIVRSFENEYCQWSSFNDWGRTRTLNMHMTGVVYEVERNKRILVAKSKEEAPSRHSSLVKVVAWSKLQVGGTGKYLVQIRDYPSWDGIPAERLVSALPKSHHEFNPRNSYSGILVN